jgi:hypothetical protein
MVGLVLLASPMWWCFLCRWWHSYQHTSVSFIHLRTWPLWPRNIYTHGIEWGAPFIPLKKLDPLESSPGISLFLFGRADATFWTQNLFVWLKVTVNKQWKGFNFWFIRTNTVHCTHKGVLCPSVRFVSEKWTDIKCMCRLWWTNWHWDRVLLEYFGFLRYSHFLSAPFSTVTNDLRVYRSSGRSHYITYLYWTL